MPRAQLPSYPAVPLDPPPEQDNLGPVRAESEERDESPPITREEVQRLIRSQQPQVVPRQEVPSSPLPSAETTTLTVPGTSLRVPVPKAEIVSAAAVTSVISVGATLAATSVFKRLVSAMKPVLKAAAKKVQKLRGKPVLTFGRQRLALRRSRPRRKGSPA